MKSDAERRAEELLRNIGEAAPSAKEDTWTDIVARVDEAGPVPADVASGRRRPVLISVAASFMVVAAATGLFVAAQGSSTDGGVRVASQPDQGDADSPSEQASTPGSAGSLAQECAQIPVVSDRGPVDWAAVEGSFGADGPFSLPPRPTWLSADSYCSMVLFAQSSVTPTTPDGENSKTDRPLVNGPNRFVYGPIAVEGESVDAVLINGVNLRIYPASVHVAYSASGKEVGYFALGVEFADRTDYPTAQSVIESPVFQSAVDQLVASCVVPDGDCDSVMLQAVTAGKDANIGELAPLPSADITGLTSIDDLAVSSADDLVEAKRTLIELSSLTYQGCEGLRPPKSDGPAIAEEDQWPEPVLDRPVGILSFGCQAAYVDGAALFGDDALSPSPATRKDGELVGYWIRGVGVLPPEIVNDPAFDMAIWQEAREQLDGAGLLNSPLCQPETSTSSPQGRRGRMSDRWTGRPHAIW